MLLIFSKTKQATLAVWVALGLSLTATSGYAATADVWKFTDWEKPQAIIVAPSAAGIPYVEQAELGPPSFGVYGNKFGVAIATWHGSGISWLAANAPNEADDAGAVYIFSQVDGQITWHQEARLTASDATENDGFGSSVAIGENVVVIGSPYHKIGSISGAVYTFVRDSTTGKWTQRGDALGVGAAGSFGSSVALSGDKLAVGAPGVGTSGHVYVYENSGASWTTVGSLSPNDSPADADFGESIAFSDGQLLIGAPADSTFAKYEGSAYVFVYQSETNSWEQQQKLVPYPDGAAGDDFGESVAIREQRAFVGAPGRNSYNGAVDIFSFDSGRAVWTEQGILQGLGMFGHSLALSADLLAVGSRGTNDDNAVSLYTLDGGTATFQSKIPAASETIAGDFGQSLSWSNGNLLASSPQADVDSSQRGLIHQFSQADMGWTERQPIYAHGDQGEYFGVSVATSGNVAAIVAQYQHDDDELGAVNIYNRDVNGNWIWQQALNDSFQGPVAIDGNTLIVGAPDQSFGDSIYQGAAYIYGLSSGLWAQQAELGDLDFGKTGDQFGASVAVSGSTAIVGTPGISKGRGGAYAYVRSGTTWTRQAELIPDDAASGDYIGAVVALRGNTALVAAPYSFGSSTGTVYVFERNGAVWTEKKKLLASDGATGDGFGASLALTDEAIFIGAYTKQIGTTYQQGRVYVFSGTDWNTQSIIDSPAGVLYGRFGGSLAVDGNRLAVGEVGQTSVYSYYLDKGHWTLQSSLTDSSNSNFGYSVAAANGTLLVGAFTEGNGTQPGGRAYIFQDDRIFADSIE